MGGLAKNTDSVRHRGRRPKRTTVHADIRRYSDGKGHCATTPKLLRLKDRLSQGELETFIWGGAYSMVNRFAVPSS
jgi:hypothetical protein